MVPKKNAVYDDIRGKFGLVPGWMEEIPESSLAGFWNLMSDFYLADTKIPNKYKDLIGIAVSGATRCRYCVLFHTEAARLNGATDAEIAEASMMGGVTMLGSTFLNAQGYDYDTFAKETKKIVDYVAKQQKPRTREMPAGHAK